jgi:hypothetical protein
VVVLALALLAGTDSCRPCHLQIFDSYTRTAHYQTSRPAGADAILGSFEEGRNILKTGRSGVWFRMERRPDGFYQTAHQNGRTRTERFDVVIGSGRRGQTYLYQKGAQLYQLPVSYLALTGDWINSPGYEDGRVYFDRLVPPVCLNCHATYTTQFVSGLTCQKCHGEGHGQKVKACADCHSGLGSTPKLDVHGNQVGLLASSQCFQRSGMLTCTTCHNPHRRERDPVRLSAKCLGCHVRHESDNCVECHMPAQESQVITFRSPGGQLSQRYRTHAIGVYPPRSARVTFTEVAAQAGVSFRHENGASAEKHMFETFGSGVAWIDYDGDGWQDLFFVNGADLAQGKPSPGNVLYRNLGNGKFEDVTRKAGLAGSGRFGTGVAVGDYDNDGRLDLYVTGFGGSQLLRNEGNGAFTDVTGKAGVGAAGWSSSAGFLDYDRDGDLDLYVARYLDYDIKKAPYCGYKKDGYRMYCDPREFDGAADLLFRNNGDGTFTDVSRAAGVANPAGKGLGVAFGDVDGDGWTDIYVANDGVRNFLYRNKGDGTFEDIAHGSGVGFDGHGKPQAGMGTEIADFDGDGRPDIFVTNFSEELNTLYRNLGGGVFEDVSEKLGLQSGFLPLGFGTKLFDFDNDGDLDIYVTNGHVIDNVHLYNPRLAYRQKDLLYENAGGRFRDVSAASGPAFQIEHVGRGAAVADYDNDGDLDIAVSDCGGRALLLRNDGGNRNHWIGVEARGSTSNRFGYGARVRLTAGGRTQWREITPVASYLSSNDLRLFFGLGAETRASRVEILWPSGAKQVLENLEGGRVVAVREPAASGR